MQLRRHIGATEWERREKDFQNEDELEKFAARKVGELDIYDEVLEKLEENQAIMESGNMTKEQFVAQSFRLLNRPGYFESQQDS